MNWTIERVASTTSTMDEARVRARAGAPDGTIVVAEEMTDGRGTHGRIWHAPKGGLYLSIVLREMRDPHLLTLALGNAVADSLEVAGADARLKWVNDVWIDGKKVAGILVEGESTGPAIDFMVAGIGINVNGRAAALGDAAAVATTLEDALGAESCIPDLETFLLQSVGKWLQKVREGQDAEIIAAFRARDALVGKSVRLEDSGKIVDGVADGIDDLGHLRIRTGGAIQTFANGTVRLR